MFILGIINKRQILYCNIRKNADWINQLPQNHWILFSITNNEDKDLINDTIEICVDKKVGYTCAVGELSVYVEDCFDEEYAYRKTMNLRINNNDLFNVSNVLMTTSHENFGEGFWFATTLARNDPFVFDKVICLDFTTRGVKGHIVNLIEKINHGWLPSDEIEEKPIYDT